MIGHFLSKIKFRHILCFFAFIAGWPCVFYLMGWLPDYKINYMVLLGVLAVFCLSKGAAVTHSTIRGLIIVQCVAWVFFALIHADTAYFTRIVLLLIVYFILAIQYRYHSTTEYIKIYNGWLTLQAICGTIGVLLVLVNILQPLSTFIEMDGRQGYFFGLFTTNALTEGFVRNAGFFDEAGALAFWGMLALLFNKCFINDKRIEKLLIIGLISTFSMAYYIQVVLYIILFNNKGRLGLGSVLVMIGVLLLIMNFFAGFSEQMDEAIFGRFQMNQETGHLEGDNRTQLTIITLGFFLKAPIFGMGASGLISAAEEADVFVGANPLALLAADGIVGYGISLLPFIFILVKNRNNRFIRYAWLILLTGFLQRPYDGTQLLYPLTMYLFLQAELLYGRKYSEEVEVTAEE